MAFRALFDKNDPQKRIMVLVNFNTDVSQYWEFSALGFQIVPRSNEAYKLGVNYLVYALTHQLTGRQAPGAREFGNGI